MHLKEPGRGRDGGQYLPISRLLARSAVHFLAEWGNRRIVWQAVQELRSDLLGQRLVEGRGLDSMIIDQRQQLLRIMVESVTMEDGRVRLETVMPTMV